MSESHRALVTRPKDRNQCEPDALVVIVVMVEVRRVVTTVNLMCLEARSAMELLHVTDSGCQCQCFASLSSHHFKVKLEPMHHLQEQPETSTLQQALAAS